VTGGELFEDIVAREFYSEADARYAAALPVERKAITIFLPMTPRSATLL